MASRKEQVKQLEKSLKSQQKEINRGFETATSLYDQQLAQLQQIQPEYEKTITEGYDVQKPILQQQAQTGLENVAMQKEQTRAGRETALAGARRQYEETMQRSQQLFGGVGGSSAGQATAEYLGAQTQRSMGQARQQSEQALLQLGATEREINTNLTNKLAELEVNKTRAITQDRDVFRQEINTIKNQKGVLAINKANAQIQALQDFNTRRQNLDNFYEQQRIALSNYAEQSKIDIDKYEKQLNIQSKYPQLFQSGSTAQAVQVNNQALANPDTAKKYLNQLISNYTPSELLKAGVVRDNSYSIRNKVTSNGIEYNPGVTYDVVILPDGVYERGTGNKIE